MNAKKLKRERERESKAINRRNKIRRLKKRIPGGSEDRNADGNGNADGREGVRGDSDEGVGPRA